jgi:hypothetical protein
MSENRPPNLPPWAGVETEPFRVFWLTNFEAQSATDGELLGAFLRCTVEMLCRDRSGAVVEHLRHQADLAEAMLPPRAERPPAPYRHPWRRYASYSPTPDKEGRPSPAEAEKADQPAKDKTPTVDKALDTDEVLDGAVMPEDDEAPPGTQRDHKYEEELQAEAQERDAELSEKYRREDEELDAALLAHLEGNGGQP